MRQMGAPQMRGRAYHDEETKQLLKLQLGMVRYGLIAAAVLIAFSAALGVAYFFAFVVA